MGLYTWKFPFRKMLGPLAQALKGIDPDVLSYLAVAVALATGACLMYAPAMPKLLLAAIVLTFLRMTLNTLDGVIAIAQGKQKLEGEIVNALPDRYSDIFVMLGIAFSAYCNPYLGALAAVCVLLVSYTGMLGKAIGMQWQHHGPLGKVERLIIIMIACLAQYLMVRRGLISLSVGKYSLTAIEIAMLVFVVLSQVTVYNRLRGMLAQIREARHGR